MEEFLADLRALQYSTAYTGELGQIKQGSYVSYGQITKLIGKYEKRLKLEKGV
jgi:O6-methylguanine-DNA--protein-cysteine methyltransferase